MKRWSGSPSTPAGFSGAALGAEGVGKDIELAIGSLDHPEAAPPSEQVGVESKLSWFDALPSLTAHRTEDERTAADLVKLRTFQHPDHDTTAWPAKSSR